MSQCLFYLLILSTIATVTYQDERINDSLPNEDVAEDLMLNDDYGVKTSYHRRGSKTREKFIFKGGCKNWPETPINGQIYCSSESGCRTNCKREYQFPNGENHLNVICHDGQWHIPGTEWTSIPHCEPICLPQCLNNGICIGPNQCECPDNFSGPQCQFETKPCLNLSPAVQNAARRCNDKSCTVSCLNGFTFPDGSAVANMACRNGNWIPSRSDWVSIPDCIPVCSPPCQNGGICLALNTCQCPQDFRGSQCQYHADTCSPRKLGFNGGYKCNGDSHSYTCTLHCPSGINFTFQPAAEYVCTYERGSFEPQPLPQCKIDPGYQLIPIQSSKNSYMKITNHSWIVEGLSREAISEKSYTYEMIKGSKGTKTDHFIMNQELQNNIPDLYQSLEETSLNVEGRKPEPKTCFTWGGIHYKTFDGAVYSFENHCPYTLLQDTRDGIFTITVQNSPGCRNGGRCHKIIKIYLEGKEYSLSLDEHGIPVFRTVKKILPIPGQLSGIRVHMAAHFLIISLDSIGASLQWDSNLFVQLKASESLWNRTGGLCGKMNGDPRDDKRGRHHVHFKTIAAFTSEWKIQNSGDTCEENSGVIHLCDSNESLHREAKAFCTQLFSNPKFLSCSKVIDLASLRTTCQWDYCNCKSADRRTCACETMSVYVRQCLHDRIINTIAWREQDTCPLTCTGGRVYKSCGPKTQPSCNADAFIQSTNELDCEEGCYCPEGAVLYNGTCISMEECPCILRGRVFKPGATIPNDCNTCTCSSGKWSCTQIECSARCAAVGDPHYITFDGKHYDFMGKCNYYLVKGEDYSIETENVACQGAISETMGFTRANSGESPSCTKSVTIRLTNITITLQQHRQVFVNNKEITTLPVLAGGVKIRIASSIFLVAKLPNGLEIWWDGISRVYVNAPAELRGKTKGLCGTFNRNQKDDFSTPFGDTEQSVVDFANKWKTTEQCEDVPKKDFNHPCDLNPERLAIAEKHCFKIWSELFASCHWYVDPESFYRDCKYDMCSCEGDIKRCMCPTFAAYAKECAANSVNILWRTEVEECKLPCPAGQEYQICGNSCTRSCNDISFNEDCRQECVEGCNCPEGRTLNAYGECIPIGECPCMYNGIEYNAGHREIRSGTKKRDLCTCTGGLWSCRPAAPEEIQQYPPINLNNVCSSLKNLKPTTCEPVEPITCRNMHKPIDQSPAICRSGCICKEGYVLDSISGNCVKKENCPCYHGGKSFKDNATMQEECNTCKCESGNWICTNRICAGVCSAWGDSHFKTFDDKTYDFQGICDYVLAKSSFGNDECFEVATQNVPCGSLGVACSKAITLTVGNGKNQERITLTKDKPLPKTKFNRIIMREAGIFIFLDVPDLGLTLQWDKGTRVYIKIDPKWKTRTKGLCGDYNDNSEDDFKTPSGGIPEASARLFGDSWKKDNHCSEPISINDTCTLHPERRIWAVEKCSTLKSSLFQACHSEVDIEPYIERCIFDTCGCDGGGDCECFCTALAAYAHECNQRGVPVKWRSQDLCPMQCDEKCSTYSPCISTCPRETCDNLVGLQYTTNSCSEDTCVEGCLLKSCPDGQVYRNNTFDECVPRSTCKPICLQKDDILYYEGDKISSDACQTCFCSRGKVICNGAPCTSTVLTTVVPMEESEKCISGWTEWLNRNIPKIKMTKGSKKSFDIEPLPSMIDLLGLKNSSRCSQDRMVGIKCRSVEGHSTPKETGLDVECSLERGLYCQSKGNELPCIDFEISVLCDCEDSTTQLPITTTTMSPNLDECKIDNLNHPHPTDCHMFYECAPGLGGNKLVKKTCGASMLYNPTTMTCDWSYNVIKIRPECGEMIKTTTEAPGLCRDDEKFDECAIQCNRTCEHYHHQLIQQNLCTKNTDCIPGCLKNTCPPDKFWRDANTCVELRDCLCKSHTGKPVKPGEVVEESQCERCQCLNNYYTCDKSLCSIIEATTVQTVTPTSFIEDHTTIVPSTVSPAKPCISGEYKSLLKSGIFNASSTETPTSPLKTGQIKGTRAKSSSKNYWQPKYMDSEQWLEIKFPRVEPIYGIILGGNPKDDKYVTSYKVLFSQDGNTFSYMPLIYQGPIDSSTPVKQIFNEPIEAKILRINPQTWHHGISMKLDVLGCQDESIEQIIPTTSEPVYKEEVKQPICDDSMGLDNGIMVEEQVIASSSLDSLIPNLKLSSPGIWRPKLDKPNQYVVFDFVENRNLTGIETKGDNDIWTTAYQVFYSNDRRHWNSIIDSAGLNKIFLGNWDDVTRKINYFDQPIDAKYLKIQPIKWHNHVGLKAEVHGCFVPYPARPTPPKYEELRQPTPCNVCHDIFHSPDTTCKCKDSLWWNGETCVEKHYCPCIVSNIPYKVGTVFETADCKKCLCTIDGTPDCQTKICEPCNEPNTRSVVTELCGCVCQACPKDTILCPTSNTCIDESLWCNGVKNCPDDETNCNDAQKRTNITYEFESVEIKNVTRIECETPVCPPNYKLAPLKKAVVNRPPPPFPGAIKGKFKGPIKSRNRLGHQRMVKEPKRKHFYTKNSETQVECQQFSCVPTKPPPILDQNNRKTSCPKVECPPNYRPVFEPQSMYKLSPCPKYMCLPPPPVEAVCNIKGRTFNTFDGYEYKYDICNHILARDMYSNKWYITLEKHCDKRNPSCSLVLAIVIDNDAIILYPDMYVDINEYSFTPKQITRFVDKKGAFKISRVGDVLHFISNKYGFWIMWDQNSNAKIGITTRLSKQVDGLCGYYDGIMENDKQKPDGNQAKTFEDFGNSWVMDDTPECDVQVCPRHMYDQAKQFCHAIKDRSFEVCSSVIDLDKYISKCIESACLCINGNMTSDNCRCRVLSTFATECQATGENIDLSTWRNIQNCQLECPAPLVHKDCYRNKCEASCENLQDIEPCPPMQGACFSGCFCPDGLVRNGDKCVPPRECRNCVCDGFGNSNFVTFDRKNFTFAGNCSYILSQDIAKRIDIAAKGKSHVQDEHTYRIIMTNGLCKERICTEIFSIIYSGHFLEIQHETQRNEISLTLDGQPIEILPYKNSWLELEITSSNNIKLLILPIQLEMTVFRDNFAFKLRLPSQIFGEAIEGLCGNCNSDIEDDFKKPNGEIIEDMNDFGMSWLATGLPSVRMLSDEYCTSQTVLKCPPPLPINDLCLSLLNPDIFGQCHSSVDPMPYVDSCHNTLCEKGNICADLERYASTCRESGFCPDWRSRDLCPYTCREGLEYQPCGSSCSNTCESLNDIEKSKCTEFPLEGCFCPENHVYHNDTCIPESKCFICDDEGHVDGDVWFPDKCTTCSCNKKNRNCKTTECPILDTVCNENYTPVVTPNSEGECCPKYVCVPMPTVAPTCQESQPIECGYGQTMKLRKAPDGCYKFICECLSPEECPPLDNEIDNEIGGPSPGYVQIINSTGCCPRAMQICKPETCPSPQNCPQYYTVETKEIPNTCCPIHECKAPEDTCLYTPAHHHKGIKGSHVVPIKIGEIWKDGLCKECTCEKSYNRVEHHCTTTECNKISAHADYHDYVLQSKDVGQCCPQYERIACKYNETVHEVGTEWHPNDNDICYISRCENGTNGIEISNIKQECPKNCDQGYEYRESVDRGVKCCGECIPVACVIDGTLRNIGEEWSSHDFCSNYTCLLENGKLRVKESVSICEKINPAEEEHFEIQTEHFSGVCCPKYRRSACKFNGTVYQADETWKNPDNSCITEKCVNGPEQIEIKEIYESCNKTCELGWEYQEPAIGECCGQCKQTYCVMGGYLYKPETVWTSNDNCTNYECNIQHDQIMIISSSTSCPDISQCTEENLYIDGCCKKCKTVSLNQERTCAAEVLELNSTIGILMEERVMHGVCRNLDAIPSYTECRGACKSTIKFDSITWHQQTMCTCCQPMEFKNINVEFTCEDRTKFDRNIYVPVACSCEYCQAPRLSIPSKGHRKGTKS